MNLKTNFGEKRFVQSSNLTQIEPGYNEITFENNRILLEPICAEILYPKNEGLKGPEKIKINPNAKVAYGWPFIEH